HISFHSLFHFVLAKYLFASPGDDRQAVWPVTIFCFCSLQRRLAPDSAWHKHFYVQNCNQTTAVMVIATGVDALSATWIILMQVRLFMLRSSMTIRRLAHWCGSFTRSWPKSSALIARVEQMRRIFAR